MIRNWRKHVNDNRAILCKTQQQYKFKSNTQLKNNAKLKSNAKLKNNAKYLLTTNEIYITNQYKSHLIHHISHQSILYLHIHIFHPIKTSINHFKYFFVIQLSHWCHFPKFFQDFAENFKFLSIHKKMQKRIELSHHILAIRSYALCTWPSKYARDPLLSETFGIKSPFSPQRNSMRGWESKNAQGEIIYIIRIIT